MYGLMNCHPCHKEYIIVIKINKPFLTNLLQQNMKTAVVDFVGTIGKYSVLFALCLVVRVLCLHCPLWFVVWPPFSATLTVCNEGKKSLLCVLSVMPPTKMFLLMSSSFLFPRYHLPGTFPFDNQEKDHVYDDRSIVFLPPSFFFPQYRW